VCDLETSRIGAPYIYNISNLRVNACAPIEDQSYIQTAILKNQSMRLIIPVSVNILLGRREYILNKQLGMEVYMKLVMIWRLECTFAASKSFFVGSFVFSYCSIYKYAFFPRW
jgi:Na+/serine symporter